MPSVGSDAAAPRTLRIASYNVHGCVGADRRFDLDRIARVLREIDADVVGVQELGAPRHRALDPWVELADRTGYAPVPGATRMRRGTPFGNGILTRLPVRRFELLDLSVGTREPRGAIDATLDWNAHDVRVVVTHFGLLRAERRVQGERLLARVVSCDAALSLLLGDFNEWLASAAWLGGMRQALGAELSVPSFPALLPLLSLDRIWVRPDAAVVRVSAHRTRTARVASDHLPVVAEVSLPG